jgi:hypothetical protein
VGPHVHNERDAAFENTLERVVDLLEMRLELRKDLLVPVTHA